MLSIDSGKSGNDRISFYSNNNGVTAIRNKNGEISFEFNNKKTSLKTVIIFLLLSIIKSLFLVPLIKNRTISTTYYLIPTFIYLFLIIINIIQLRKLGGKEFLKNHGAEHMVFEAYKKLKRSPTILEISEFSKISRHCGINIFSAFITCQIIGYIVYISTSYIISEIILFIIPFIFYKSFPFNLLGKALQLLTTSEPDSKNLELAIAAISRFENL